MSLVKFTVEIVKSYVARNELPADKVGTLLETVHHTLKNLHHPRKKNQAKNHIVKKIAPQITNISLPVAKENMTEAFAQKNEITEVISFLPVSESITENYIICLTCGKPCRALRGHLKRTHHMEVETYRQKYHLLPDYPIVAPSYSVRRRQLANEAKFGTKRGSIQNRT
ncbi:MAG: MucR family transcriptional regulator [Magnetococcus sp. DMHC-6]